ncbi:MAG: hypothetical protein LRZ99_03715 [Desulfotomaculum sp.]|nr:hypothetical protein [Desulfotomaculum sp.]
MNFISSTGEITGQQWKNYHPASIVVTGYKFCLHQSLKGYLLVVNE